MMKRHLKMIVALMLVSGITACGMPMHEFNIMPPQVNRISHTYKALASLPEPKGKIRVSVYNFRDQTGQYKPQENVSSFSTAVTQGAVNMLTQALVGSKWFVPVEREGLQSLLTERKIIAAAKRNGNGDKNNLPPLEWANVLLQGGITSYETNTITGGFGAEYWGLGGSVQYRQDQVTVHLRAVDVNTGRILKSVSTTKTVFSHAVDAGFFRFLTFKKLLEIEAGYSHNEPVQMCVAAAIEKAVIALVIEGVLDQLWLLKNPEDLNSPVIKEYREEQGQLAVAANLEATAAKAAAERKAAVQAAEWAEKQKELQSQREADEQAAALKEAAEAKAAAEREAAAKAAELAKEKELQAQREAEQAAALKEAAEAKAAAEREAADKAAELEKQQKETQTKSEAEQLTAQEEAKPAATEERGPEQSEKAGHLLIMRKVFGDGA